MTEPNDAQKPNRDGQTSQGQTIPVKIIKNDEPLRVTDRRFWVRPETDTEETAGDYSFKPTYVQELERKLSDAQKKLDEVLASYREFKTESAVEIKKARERILNEYGRRLAQAKSELLKRFIDVLENLERALAAPREGQTVESLLEGIHLIRNQFVSILAELGVKELDLIGLPFDPQKAEAVGIVEVNDEQQDQRVIEVVSKGYLLEEGLVRPAKVKVGKCPAAVSESSPSTSGS